MGAAEQAAIEEYLRQQHLTLAPRHPMEDLILLRVLSDHHQHAAMLAKRGNPDRAFAEMRGLDQIPRPRGAEMDLVYHVSAGPVWALILWLEGHPNDASKGLLDVLDATRQLVTKYGHAYLTGKRIHLAANLCRLDATGGDPHRALANLGILQAVIEGDRSEWRYGAADQLDVPLNGPTRDTLIYQLGRIEALATKAAEDKTLARDARSH